MPKRGFSCVKSQKELHRDAKRRNVERTGTFHSISVELFKEPVNQKILHRNAKKRRLAYGDVPSVTCRRNLFPKDQSQKEIRKEAISKNPFAQPIDTVLACKGFGYAPPMMNL